jgi:hypothetical protein
LRNFLIVPILASAVPLFAADAPGVNAIQPQNIAAHIKQPAPDEFEGRAPGTRGETLTIRYLAEQFERAGATAGNPDGTYLARVEGSDARLKEPSTMPRGQRSCSRLRAAPVVPDREDRGFRSVAASTSASPRNTATRNGRRTPRTTITRSRTR